jgi:hypothetical protein
VPSLRCGPRRSSDGLLPIVVAAQQLPDKRRHPEFELDNPICALQQVESVYLGEVRPSPASPLRAYL